MGYNSENASKLCFDVETAPLPEAADYIECATAPANYRDEAKIKDYIRQANAENLSKCGLDVDLCRVVAIGLWLEGGAGPYTQTLEDGRSDLIQDEASLLAWFWRLSDGRHLVGFNCLGFDLPVLLRRSLYLGVPAPRIQIDRFKHPQVTDLMDELSYGGKLRLRGLSFYARRFGIASDPDTLTGADIALAVAEGRWEAIEAHVRADVQKTAALASKLGYFRMVTTEPEMAL